MSKITHAVDGRELCEACAPDTEEANHPVGMIFVGWGHGWQPCQSCGGSGLKEPPALASLKNPPPPQKVSSEMGEPTPSTPAEREAVHAYAASVLDAARQHLDQPHPRWPDGDAMHTETMTFKLAQEVTILREALEEALGIADQNLFVPSLAVPEKAPIVWSGTITVDSGYPYRTKARLAELRQLLGVTCPRRQ